MGFDGISIVFLQQFFFLWCSPGSPLHILHFDHQVYVGAAKRGLWAPVWQGWQGLGAQLWWVHLYGSEGQSALGVICFFFDKLETSFSIPSLPRMEQCPGSGGPACLWRWICCLAWLSCACELMYQFQSIDTGMSSLNVAAASEAANLADLAYNKNKLPTLSDLPPFSKMAIEKIRDLGDQRPWGSWRLFQMQICKWLPRLLCGEGWTAPSESSQA